VFCLATRDAMKGYRHVFQNYSDDQQIEHVDLEVDEQLGSN
jgi:hypothetical protein